MRVNDLASFIAKTSVFCFVFEPNKKTMGKIKTDSLSFWNRLGGVKKTSFKNKLMEEYKKRKETQRALKNSFVDEKQVSKQMMYPTGYKVIESETPQDLHRHLYLTGSAAISNMMEDKTVNEVNEKTERFMSANQEPLLNFASRLFSNFDAFYTPTDDALCHFVAAAEDPILRQILQRSSQFLLDAEDRSVRVYADGIDTSKSLERYVSVETSFTPTQDIGPDLVAFAKLISWISKLHNVKTNVLKERVRWSCERKKTIKSAHDLEGVTAQLMEKRQKHLTPMPGLSFVNTVKPNLMFYSHEKDFEERVIFELLIKLPEVSAAKKEELKENLNKNHRISSVVQYLAN